MTPKEEQPQTRASQSPSQPVGQVLDAGDGEMAKRVLKKIDYYIIPVLFITYMVNFMDKTILSSASVFGLRDDTVSSPRSRPIHRG